MPVIRFTDEARSQFRRIPHSIQREYAEIFPWLERNPLHPPPWVDQKRPRGRGRFQGVSNPCEGLAGRLRV